MKKLAFALITVFILISPATARPPAETWRCEDKVIKLNEILEQSAGCKQDSDCKPAVEMGIPNQYGCDKAISSKPDPIPAILQALEDSCPIARFSCQTKQVAKCVKNACVISE